MTEKFRVVCYRRVEEKTPPMTWAKARKERKLLQLLHRNYFYVIEEVKR